MISRNLIGPLPAALAGLAKKHHGLVLQAVNVLKGDNQDFFHQTITAALRQKPPAPAPEPPKPAPTLIEIGILEVNCDETIAQKLAGITDPAVIAWHTSIATDENFPDARTGIKRYKASAACFHEWKAHDAIERWCCENGKILGLAKDGIDLAKRSPRPALDDSMPLALAGFFLVDADRGRYALYFRRDGAGERDLGDVWLGPRGEWGGNWFFLVLEELLS